MARLPDLLDSLPPRYAPPARIVQHVPAFESIPKTLRDEVQQELGVFALDTPLPDGASAPF